VEEKKISLAERRVSMEAILARTDLYKTQLEVFGQMHQTNPSPELVAAVKDATEAFNAAGGSSCSMKPMEEGHEYAPEVGGM